MAFKAGGFYFPTSSGNFYVDVGFEPQGAMFFGSNISDEDVMVATSYPGIFYGMIWRTMAGSLDSQCVANSMLYGINVKPHPIVMPSTTGTAEDYRAELGSFDPEGFTLNVTNPASAPRLIHYLVWGEFDGANGAASNAGTIALPYRPLTGIGFNYRTSSGIRDGSEDGAYNTMYVGGANWPDIESPPSHTNRTWGTAGFSRIYTVDFNGFVLTRANFNPPQQFNTAINFMTGDGILTIDEEILRMWRDENEDIVIEATGGPFRYFGQWWTGEGYASHITVPSTLGGQATFTAGGSVDAIGAAWFAGILGDSDGGLNTSCRMTLGVLTDEYQGCVAASREGAGWAFQSQNMCVVESFDEGVGGVRAASAEIIGKEIITTTEIADSAQNASPVAFVYQDDEDIQQFFRILK